MIDTFVLASQRVILRAELSYFNNDESQYGKEIVQSTIPNSCFSAIAFYRNNSRIYP
jgi:hypothetical protein